MRFLLKSALEVVVVLGAAGFAMLPAAQAQAELVPPRAVDQPPPRPARNRLGLPMEGWVVLRYTVLADGRTANVRVIDRMPPTLGVNDAVSAVKAWTFDAATDNGTAIEWHNNVSVVVFDVDTIPLEPNPFFVPEYLEIDELIKAEEYDKALARNENLLLSSTSRLADVGLAQGQNAVIHLALGDLHAAYAAILRATDPRVLVLPPGDLKLALQYRNALELELGDAVGALATFARRNEIEPVPQDDPTVASAAAIEQVLAAGNAPIAIKAKILDEHWIHALTRRTFALAEVKGTLVNIQVDCNRRVAELPYAPDSEWALPDGWGACSLTIEGDRETEFVLYEFP